MSSPEVLAVLEFEDAVVVFRNGYKFYESTDTSIDCLLEALGPYEVVSLYIDQEYLPCKLCNGYLPDIIKEQIDNTQKKIDFLNQQIDSYNTFLSETSKAPE